MSQFRGLFSILCLILVYSSAQAWNFAIDTSDRTSKEGEFPWVVTVLDRCGPILGGGSLISNYVVLTAWKVVEDRNASELTLQMGEWGSVQPLKVRTIVRHPSFNHTTGAYNLALLFLRMQVEFTPKIRPINLATQTSIRNLDLNRCIVKGTAGWMTLPMAVVPTATCLQELRRWLGPLFQLDASLMCAGGGIGRNVCDEDGYPLVCPLATDPVQFQQVGIVNWHINCGQHAVPDVYTNVGLLREGINHQIRLNPYVDEPEDQEEPHKNMCNNYQITDDDLNFLESLEIDWPSQ